MSACLHLCNLPGPNSEQICTLTDHVVCWLGTAVGKFVQAWKLWPSQGVLVGLVFFGFPGTGQGGLLTLTRSTSQERPDEVQPMFHHPLRVPVGSSESQRFPRKQKQICLVINLAYVWCSLAFPSSYFIALHSQKEQEVQHFNHNWNFAASRCICRIHDTWRIIWIIRKENTIFPYTTIFSFESRLWSTVTPFPGFSVSCGRLRIYPAYQWLSVSWGNPVMANGSDCQSGKKRGHQWDQLCSLCWGWLETLPTSDLQCLRLGDWQRTSVFTAANH